MSKHKLKPPGLLMNTGGVYDGHTVTYTEAELQEVARYIFWQDPLNTRRKPKGERWYDASEDKPIVPNWAEVRKRERWITHFAGVTLELGKTLTGDKWILYLGGQVQLGPSGGLPELKDRGTAFLLALMVRQEQDKQKEETE